MFGIGTSFAVNGKSAAYGTRVRVEANRTRSLTARIPALVAGVAVSAMILGVLGIAGVIPGGIFGMASDAPHQAPREPIGSPFQPAECPLCGTVESVRILELRVAAEDAQSADISGASTPGRTGRDNDSVTIVETVIGAVTRNEGGKKTNKRLVYRVTVRMDDGSYRTVSQSSPPAFAVGDKVRVVEGRLVRT